MEADNKFKIGDDIDFYLKNSKILNSSFFFISQV